MKMNSIVMDKKHRMNESVIFHLLMFENRKFRDVFELFLKV